MQISDFIELPFRVGAEIRHRRAFHPVGVFIRGTVDRTAPSSAGLPLASGEVLGRLSKGLGLPAGLPDFAGLAWRVTTGSPDDGSTPWDVLMVSAGSSPLGRVVLRPALSWSRTTFSTLMPLGYRGNTWWLRARLIAPIDTPDLSLTALTRALRDGGAIRVFVEQARGFGGFAPFATLTFTELLPESRLEGIALDPTVHTAPGVRLLPAWLTRLRRGAYRGSRQGRNAQP